MVGFYCPDSQLNPTREGRRPIFLCRRGGQLKSNLNFGFPAVFRFTRPGRRYGQPPPRIFLVWIREKLDTRATGNPRNQQKKSNRPPPPNCFEALFFQPKQMDGIEFSFNVFFSQFRSQLSFQTFYNRHRRAGSIERLKEKNQRKSTVTWTRLAKIELRIK